MNIKTITQVALIIIVLIAGLIWLTGKKIDNQGTETGKPDKPSALSLDMTAFDFGSISMANGKVKHNFTLSNNSGSDVKVVRMYTSCMCTKASLIKDGKMIGPFGMPGHGMLPSIDQIIKKGEKAEVEVVFDPAAHGPAGVGPIVRDVIIETDDNAKLTLEIKAQVTP